MKLTSYCNCPQDFEGLIRKLKGESIIIKDIENTSRDELDYSAFILYLGKIVETELNLSVCQMLRQSMGIDMPDFYNRYCYKTDKTIIPTENKDIPLNKYINVSSTKFN